MPKIYLSPSRRPWNTCVCGDDEQAHCRQYIDYLTLYLDANGIDWKIDNAATVQEGVKECNLWCPDLHYVVRTACFDGRRRKSALYVKKNDDTALRCAGFIKMKREPLYGRSVFLNTNESSYELRYTRAPCIFDEIVCHDNIEDASFFHDNIQQFAVKTAEALCEFFGFRMRKPADSVPPQISTEIFIRDDEEEMISHIGPFPEDNGEYRSILVAGYETMYGYKSESSSDEHAHARYNDICRQIGEIRAQLNDIGIKLNKIEAELDSVMTSG